MLVKGLLVDVGAGKRFSIEYVDENDLDTIYKILECDCIDIVTRMIGAKAFAIVCDDEELLNANPVPSAVDAKGYPMLVGNIFICNRNGPELASLSNEDIDHIVNHNVAFYGPGRFHVPDNQQHGLRLVGGPQGSCGWCM